MGFFLIIYTYKRNVSEIYSLITSILSLLIRNNVMTSLLKNHKLNVILKKKKNYIKH